jgi:hypothetical protein
MTITRKKVLGQTYQFDRKIKWSKSDIQKYFAQKSGDPVPRKLYLGFTGTTSKSTYLNRMWSRSARCRKQRPSMAQSLLMRGAETVEATTHLKVDDVLHYDYTVNVKATSQAPWPESGTATMNVPKGKYFDYLKADGTPAKPGDTLPIKVTIGNSDYQAQGKSSTGWQSDCCHQYAPDSKRSNGNGEVFTAGQSQTSWPAGNDTGSGQTNWDHHRGWPDL